ncbi:unnamed protein product, partial [marine sediment metagenome]
KLLQHGGNARFVYNYFLKQNIDYYNKTNKFKFYYELATSLPKLKQELPFLKESFSQSLQMVIRHLDKALKDSFKKEKGFPSFKKKHFLNDSFTCPQKYRLGNGFVLRSSYIQTEHCLHVVTAFVFALLLVLICI